MSESTENQQKLLITGKKLSFQYFLCIWFIGILLPLAFIKLGIKAYKQETLPARTQATINLAESDMQHIVDKCSANAYIQHYLDISEESLGLRQNKGNKLLLPSVSKELFSPALLRSKLLSAISKNSSLKPYLLLTAGEDLKKVDSYANQKYFKFKKFGNYVTKKVFKHLEKNNNISENKRIAGIFSSIFGKQYEIKLLPEEVNTMFTTKHNGERIYIFYRFWHKTSSAKCLGGYLIAFAEQDIEARSILSWVLENPPKNTQLSIIAKQAKFMPKYSVRHDVVSVFRTLPFSILKLNAFRNKDLAKIFILRDRFKINLEEFENGYVSPYPFFSLSRQISKSISNNFADYYSLFFLVTACFSLFLTKYLFENKNISLSIRQKLLLAFISVSIVPLLLFTYSAIKLADANIKRKINVCANEMEHNLTKIDLKYKSFSNKRVSRIYNLLEELKQNGNENRLLIETTLKKYLNEDIEGILFFRSDGLFVKSISNEASFTKLLQKLFFALCLQSFERIGYDLKNVIDKTTKYKIKLDSFTKSFAKQHSEGFLAGNGKEVRLTNDQNNNYKAITYSFLPTRKNRTNDAFFISVSQNIIIESKLFLNRLTSYRETSFDSNTLGEIDTYFFIAKDKGTRIHKNMIWPKNLTISSRIQAVAQLAAQNKIGTRIIENDGNSIKDLFVIKKLVGSPIIAVSRFRPSKLPALRFQYQIYVVITFIYLFVVLSLITMALSFEFVSPIELLMKSIRLLKTGYYPRIEAKLFNEFKVIIERFNSMVNGFRERKELARFVSADATSAIIKEGHINIEPSGEKVRRTILFSHIKNFRNLAKLVKPDQLIHILNIHFNIIEPIIKKHNGNVDKYIGDAIMAVFSGNNSDHEACMAALEIKATMPQINKSLSLFNINGISIGFGIASGTVISGRVGATNSRMDFTVVGDRVNLAARLEALTHSASYMQILISNEVNTNISHTFCIKEYGEIRVKGKAKLIKAFELCEKETV